MGFGVFAFLGTVSRNWVIRLAEWIARARSGCTSVLCIMRRNQDYTDIRRLKVWIPGGGGGCHIYIYIYIHTYIHT